jgi:hypothetical protein
MRQRTPNERSGRTRALAIALSLGAMSACDSLLEADLPYLLTDAAIQGAGTAETQVNSVQALFECGISTFGWIALGHEDVFESIAGVAGGAHIFIAAPNTGLCGDADNDQSWFDQIMGARALVSTDPAKLEATGLGAGAGVYDKIVGEYNLGAAGERLAAISAMYMAMTLDHFGEFYCEGAIDGSELMDGSEFLVLAEQWVARALTHIGNFGDFTMPNNAASSAQNMAVALRAQIRWASGNLAGAAADAQTVLAADPDFNAWITREAGMTRRNRVFQAGGSPTRAGYSGILGINDWWDGAVRPPNPATGQLWPQTIPFTGYIFLGIMPNGRTLDAGNIPVRWADEQRDGNEDPVPLANGAVEDSRTFTYYASIQGPEKREIPARYSDDADDMPYISWRQLTLILAEWENVTNNDQAAAIALVNDLRTFHGLPTISGDYLTTLTDGANDQEEVRFMLFEESRREFFAEGVGRFWAIKIRNTDIAWFPRRQGQSPSNGYNLQGGVRLHFPSAEYTNNPIINAAGGLAMRGTGCPVAERPIP